MALSNTRIPFIYNTKVLSSIYLLFNLACTEIGPQLVYLILFQFQIQVLLRNTLNGNGLGPELIHC